MSSTKSVYSSFNMFQPKIQPRSSAERDNSLLLHSVLKAASTDIAHRLLDYASLEKVDCECIIKEQVTIQQDACISTKDDPIIEKKDVSIEKEKAHVAPVTDQSKTDPIMLLMAAAQVVDARRRDAYPNGRYYLKPDNKRIRTSPPTPAPSTYKVDTWRKNYRSMQDQPTESNNNSFSMQYHSMKQNPKVKQNALHTYITYMIYNDMTHGNTRRQSTVTYNHNNNTTNNSNTVYNNNVKYQQPPAQVQQQHQQQQQRADFNLYSNHPSLSSSGSSAATSSTITTSIPPSNNNSPWLRHDDRSIISRPLTAFLWNNENSSYI
ncbi:hypothetical protein EDC94DRAFT_36113 [Helicostylum pulchrum]|nr:hypothetical protein EDC94DRAFT_36113 [Helicostylum pulchrum]